MIQLSRKSHLMDSFFLFYIFESVGETSWLTHLAFIEAHSFQGHGQTSKLSSDSKLPLVTEF